MDFRAVYGHFCLFPRNKTFDKLADSIPYYEECDSVLTYGYIDHTAGLTMEILAAAVHVGNTVHYLPSDSKVRQICRVGSLGGEDFIVIEHEGNLRKQFEDKLNILSGYQVSDEIERTREEPALDELRHPFYPDDVKVVLLREGLTPEECWVRIEGIGPEAVMEGTLLNKPDQDFGVNLSDSLCFRLLETGDGEYMCIADFDEGYATKREEDRVKEQIQRFDVNPSEENFISVLETLCMADVYIPEIRLLEKEGKKYFMVFTSESEMKNSYLEEGDYSLKSFAAAMRLALGEESDVAGIIVNVLTDPFLIPKEFFALLLDLSRSNGTED